MKKYALLTALALLLAVPSFAQAADEAAASATTAEAAVAASTETATPTPAAETAAPVIKKHKHAAHKAVKHHKKLKAAEAEAK